MALTIPGKRPTAPSVPVAPQRPVTPETPAAATPQEAPAAPLPSTRVETRPPQDAASVRMATLGKALTDMADGSMDAARERDESARGALGVGSTYTKPPSRVGKPSPAPRSQFSHSVMAHGISVARDHVRMDAAGNPVGTNFSAGVVRSNLALDVTRTVAGHEVGGGVSMENGYVDASAQLGWATRDGGAAAAGGFVALTQGSVFVGGSARVADAAGRTLATSAFGRVNANRTVTDLGDVDGKRLIELQRSAGLGGMFAPGWIQGVLGVGGRLTVDRNRAVVFRTHVEPDRARELLFEKRGVVGFLRDKGRALGLVEDPVVVPSLASPETMKVGDQVVISTSGSLMGGLALGALGLRLGAEGITQGEFEVGVKKLDETHVQLVVTPTEVRGVEVFVDTPLLLEVRATRTQAGSMRQAFTFDLSTETGRAAYQKALTGELPSGLARATLDTPDARTLVDLVRSEKLPPGVTRDYLEQAQLTRSNVGGGLGFGFIESGSLAGLSAHRTRTDEKAVVTDGQVAVDTRTRGVENRREVLLSGTESCGVFASARKVVAFDAAGTSTELFEALTLTARFSDDKVRGLELNGDVLQPLNEALGTTVPPFTRDAHKEKRSVTATRALTADDLQALVRVNPQRLANAANQAGLTVTDAILLQEEMAACADVEALAASVQRFVAAFGLGGFGYLHRALPARDSLQISSTSSAYSDPVSTVDTLALKYPRPVSADDAPDAVVERFKEVGKLLQDTQRALEDVKEDVLLDDGARVAISEALTRAQKKAGTLFSLNQLTPEDNLRLRDQLDQGWVSSDEQALMATLDAVRTA